MRHTILNGDVIACLRSLPDACVQCVVTSPPYWGLRDYGVEGQIGLEPTPGEYVEKLVEVFREVWRVLRDDGVLWLNLGDSFADKNLVGVPWRVAFALQADGWYLRSDIIWSKPNPMPESVTDRPTKSHEYMFLLTKSARYFYDADAVREAHAREYDAAYGSPKWLEAAAKHQHRPGENGGYTSNFSNGPNPNGRNRRTVWEIATQPTPEAHFATFPEALVEPCIKAGTSERGACPVCGAPWRRVVEAHRLRRDELDPSDPRYRPHQYSGAYEKINGKGDAGYRSSTTLGWAPSCTCGCKETVPCVVLDPFGGSGTVAKVARDLGRSSILIEINPEYVQIAKKRLRIGEQLDSGVCEYVVKNFRTEETS